MLEISKIEKVYDLNDQKVTALKNVDMGGFSFVEVLSVCPLNWRTNNVQTWDRLKTMEEFFEVKEFVQREGLE